MFVSAGGRKFPQQPAPAFPLKVAGGNRYLVDANGSPFPVYDYAFWAFTCVSSTSDMNSWISALQGMGITAIHMSAYCGGLTITNGTPPNTVSEDMSGHLPFLKNNDGSTYTSTWGGNADLSQYNDAYFTTLSTIISACQTAGILVHLWPAYLGFNAGVQGLGSDMAASGTTKANAYATYIAGKITQSNVVWMLYGDNVPSGTLQTVQAAFANTLIANATQRPLLVGGHYPAGNGCPTSPNNTDTDGSPTAIDAIINVNTIYHWNVVSTAPDANAYVDCLDGCQQTGPVVPTFKLDPAGYEGLVVGSYSPTPNTIRTELWWSLLTSTAGVGWANTYTQYAGSPDGTNGSFTFANGNTSNGLLSDGHKHLKVGLSIHRSFPWWLLQPANSGSMGTIISSGQGSSGTTAWLASAADPGGSCIAIYVPPAGSATFSVTMTLLAGPCAAYWIDPTAGAQTTVASPQSPLANTGTHSFTTPGNNAYGAADWVLWLTTNKQKQWW